MLQRGKKKKQKIGDRIFRFDRKGIEYGSVYTYWTKNNLEWQKLCRTTFICCTKSCISRCAVVSSLIELYFITKSIYEQMIISFLLCYFRLLWKVLWIVLHRLFDELVKMGDDNALINRILCIHLEKCSFNCFRFGRHNDLCAKYKCEIK